MFEDISEAESCVDVLLRWPDYLMVTCLSCCSCPELANAGRVGSGNTFYAILVKGSLPWLMEQEIKLVENFCFSKTQDSNQVKKQFPRKKQNPSKLSTAVSEPMFDATLKGENMYNPPVILKKQTRGQHPDQRTKTLSVDKSVQAPLCLLSGRRCLLDLSLKSVLLPFPQSQNTSQTQHPVFSGLGQLNLTHKKAAVGGKFYSLLQRSSALFSSSAYHYKL